MNHESDSEDEDLDHLFEDDEEMEFLDSSKENKKYYLGASKLIRPDNYFIMTCVVSNRLFFQNPWWVTQRYMEAMSVIYIHKPMVDIMKLEILSDETYAVVKKTYWLRLMQRHWRNVLKERTAIRLKRGSIVARRHFEIHGRYPYGLNSLPCLSGMLRSYGRSNESKYKN
jgi:hypothetical protein